MSFTEIELRRIEKTVGEMCERRSPMQFRDELRTTFDVKGYDVTVYEERPHWRNPQKWIKEPVAKFKYISKDNVWKLFWMRADLKWHSYEMPRGTKTLEALVKEVDIDPHGAFFG
jgi:hypothetical protein